MKRLVSKVIHYLGPYLYDELVWIINSYLLGFNTEFLFFEKTIHTMNGLTSFKISVYNNKVYLPIYKNGLIIIYDMGMNKTFYLYTKLEFVRSIYIIDENNIVVSAFLGLYVYNINIINDKVNIISINKKNEFKDHVSDFYFFKESVVFSNCDICVKSINMNTHIKLRKFNYCYDSIFLYNNYLYFFNLKKYLIEIIDINDYHNITLFQFDGLLETKRIKKDKIMLLLPKDFDYDMSIKTSIFVNETYIYIKFSKSINVYNHDGKLIRRISINYPYLTEALYVDSNKIYLMQQLDNSFKLLIFKQEFKYKKFEKKKKKKKEYK